jgi:hypothetical protein
MTLNNNMINSDENPGGMRESNHRNKSQGPAEFNNGDMENNLAQIHINKRVMKAPTTDGMTMEEKSENEVSEGVSIIVSPSDVPTAVNASNAEEADEFNRETTAAEESFD